MKFSMIKEHWKPIVLLALLILSIYIRAIPYEWFIFDDDWHLATRDFVGDTALSKLMSVWTYSLMPIPYTVWIAFVTTFGSVHPWSFRIFSILIHSLNSYLVYLFLLNLLWYHKTSMREFAFGTLKKAAFVGACLFALHPIQVETVVWISAQKDLLGALFFLISLNLYWNLRTKGQAHCAYLIAAIGMSILSKISFLVAPLLFFFLDIFIFRVKWKELAKIYIAPLILAVIIFITYREAMPLRQNLYVPSNFLRVQVFLEVFKFNFIQMFPIIGYYFDYGKTPVNIARDIELLPFKTIVNVLFFSVIGGVFLFCVRKRRWRPYGLAILIYFIFFLPSSGLVSFSFQNISTSADRFMYIPLIGMALVFSLIYSAGSKNKRIHWFLYAALLFLYIYSFNQVQQWRTSIHYLEYTLQKNPASNIIRLALIEAYKEEGDAGKVQFYQNQINWLEFNKKE